jgi:terminase small subunit / prophage DNA-packing protein
MLQEPQGLGLDLSQPRANIVSSGAMAKHLDLSERQLRDLASREIIPRTARPGRWDLDACRVAYIRHQRELAAGRYTEGDLDLAQERAKLARAQTEKTDLETRARRKELLEAIAVEARWADLIVRARARLLSIPSKLAARIVILGAKTAEDLLRSEIYEALAELSGNAGAAGSGSGHRPHRGKRKPAVGASTKADRKRVGRSKPRADVGRKRRARAMEDVEGSVSP